MEQPNIMKCNEFFNLILYLLLLLFTLKKIKYRLCICNVLFLFLNFREIKTYYRLFWKHWSWIKRPIYSTSMKPIIKTSRYFRGCCCRYRQCFQVRFRPSRDIPYSVFAQVDLVFALLYKSTYIYPGIFHLIYQTST